MLKSDQYELAADHDQLRLANKITIATEGTVRAQFVNRLANHPNKTNALDIANFLIASKIETNISDRYKEDQIFALCKLSNHVSKDFKDFTREDILSFLDSYRKTEAADPLHKWIGTYNLYSVGIIKFFRWLYSPDVEQKKRPKPPCVENIPQLKRKETSIYKPSDIWTADEDILYLKFCPSKRDCCYHAISRDLSCRPHELLKLRIKDVVFKMVGDRQYAEVLVNGKTGQRPILLLNSIPYLKDWLLAGHPFAGNPSSPLICGLGKSIGRFINSKSVNKMYRTYKTKFFPKLLHDPSVTPEDKTHIKELLKKPWNPYLSGRHTSLTGKSKKFKEPLLKQHAGWSPRSNMHLRYIHYLGNESCEEQLEVYGLKPKRELIDRLKPTQCPNCSEANKIDSKFCVKCHMVLTYDEYADTIEEKKKKDSEVKLLREKHEKDMKELREHTDAKLDKIISMIQENPKLALLKREVLSDSVSHK